MNFSLGTRQTQVRNRERGSDRVGGGLEGVDDGNVKRVCVK